MQTINPHGMTAQQIADTATRTQILQGIDRAQQGLITATDATGWAALAKKLNEALAIQLRGAIRPARPATVTRRPNYSGKHRGHVVEFLGHDAQGLACYYGENVGG